MKFKLFILLLSFISLFGCSQTFKPTDTPNIIAYIQDLPSISTDYNFEVTYESGIFTNGDPYSNWSTNQDNLKDHFVNAYVLTIWVYTDPGKTISITYADTSATSLIEQIPIQKLNMKRLVEQYYRDNANQFSIERNIELIKEEFFKSE